MRQLILIMFFSLTLWGHAESQIEHNKTQYQSKQLVHDKSKKTLEQHLSVAFYNVLSKRSGKIITHNTNKLSTVNIQTMVERYDYSKEHCINEEKNCYQLAVYFNEEAIDSYMHNNQITAWTGPRPSTLIWLQKKSSNNLQTLSEYHPEAQQMIEQAVQRDMIVLFPNGDITDQQIMPKEVQASALEFLASKYHAQQILQGIIEQEDPLTITWHLFNQTQRHNWESTNNNLDEALSGALDHLVNSSIANLTMHDKQVATKSIIEIKQLPNYDAYTKLSNLLLTNEQISKINIMNIGIDFFTIEITHQGNTQTLLQELQNATYLQSSIESPLSEQAISSYQWIPPANE